MQIDKQSVLNKLQDRLTDLMRNSPAQDLERNMKALLGQAFSKFELVTREEFDAQIELLTSLRARVDRLEKLIAALESPTADNPPGKHPGEPS